MRSHSFLLLCFFIVLYPAFSDEEELSISKETWSVAVANLDIDDPSLLQVASLLNFHVHSDLQRITQHKLSVDERRMLAEDVIQNKEKEYLSNLSKHYYTRDSLFFERSIDQRAIEDANKLIMEERAKLEHLRARSIFEVRVPHVLPIEYRKDEDGSSSWNLQGEQPRIFRRLKELDLLITSKIIRSGDYLGISVSGWTASGKTEIWEGAVSFTQVAEISENIAAGARQLILGRPWASLELTVNPPESTIRFNGILAGVGHLKDISLKPGVITIELYAEGFEPMLVEKYLAPDSNTRLDISLDPVETESIFVRSEPPGALVRLGTLWLGTTPLMVRVPDKLESITLEKDGYQNRSIPFYPDAVSLTVPLVPAVDDPEAYLKESKRKLDNAVAWFSLSLAPTFFVLGLNQQYEYQRSTSIDPAERQLANTAFNITTGAVWGSVGLNLGLLAVVFVRLSRYLKASETLSD